MSANLNYERAKRSARGPRPEAGDSAWHQPSLRGWRTEWDGEPFPVEVTKVHDAATIQPAAESKEPCA